MIRRVPFNSVFPPKVYQLFYRGDCIGEIAAANPSEAMKEWNAGREARIVGRATCAAIKDFKPSTERKNDGL